MPTSLVKTGGSAIEFLLSYRTRWKQRHLCVGSGDPDARNRL